MNKIFLPIFCVLIAGEAKCAEDSLRELVITAEMVALIELTPPLGDEDDKSVLLKEFLKYPVGLDREDANQEAHLSVKSYILNTVRSSYSNLPIGSKQFSVLFIWTGSDPWKNKGGGFYLIPSDKRGLFSNANTHKYSIEDLRKILSDK